MVRTGALGRPLLMALRAVDVDVKDVDVDTVDVDVGDQNN